MTHTVKTALLQESTCNLMSGTMQAFRHKRPRVTVAPAAKK